MTPVRIIKIISVIILAAGFLFIHGETAPVYGRGPDTDVMIPDGFADYLTTLFNTVLNNQPMPNVPEPSPVNTFTISTSVTQKYYTPSTQASTSFYNTPEHKTELVIPYKLSPLSKDEPLMPTALPYAVTICLSYNDSTAPDCVDKKTALQASETLAEMILRKYIKGTEIRPFRVVMPQATPPDVQTRLLQQIETDAISIIETGMLEDLKSSKTVSSETEEGRAQKQNIIIENAGIARQEAQKGLNWSHHAREDKSIHAFHEGKAFVKINNFIAAGRLPERK